MYLHEHRDLPHLVVVGNGLSAVACIEQILKREPELRITVFGDEPCGCYDRTLLPQVLAGEKSFDQIVLWPLDWYNDMGITLRLGVRIVDADADAKTVSGDDGSVTSFDKLLLATGSSPVIPPIEGVKQDGVFVFRNIADARGLLDRARPGRKAVVIGGGRLGLEAAHGLRARGCDVTVVHLADRLMESRLDAAGAGSLKREVESLGMRVLLSRRTRALLGDGQVEGVEFFGGERIGADVVVIATGTRPNTDLGLCADLTVNRGIVVDDHMQTSHPDIFAVGECAEHRGKELPHNCFLHADRIGGAIGAGSRWARADLAGFREWQYSGASQ